MNDLDRAGSARTIPVSASPAAVEVPAPASRNRYRRAPTPIGTASSAVAVRRPPRPSAAKLDDRALRHRQQERQQAMRRLEAAERTAWARLRAATDRRPADGRTPGAVVPPARRAVGRAARGRTRLEVRTLGPWRVTVDDVVVGHWPGRLRRSLLAFMVSHRHPPPTREMLMETFWPGTSPDAARNSLNVAIHGLRCAFRTIRPEPVIVFTDGQYRFAPEIAVWIDADDFERRLECARALEETEPHDLAVSAYENALTVYCGDFLADVPYEEWTTAPRERLRLAHLDALVRLSALYFEQDRYGRSADLCRWVLERDPCREDVHRRLMRCHAREGQTHLALRAYSTCARTLVEQLGIRPSAATTALHARLRSRQRV